MFRPLRVVSLFLLTFTVLVTQLPSSVIALPPPLSDELLALIDTANVYFDFHAKNSLQPATWLVAPSGSTTAGLILIDGPEMAMDFGDPDMYFADQKRFPTPMWYFPIDNNCDPGASIQPAECSSPDSLISDGWTFATWINLNSLTYGTANVFSALEGGFTLTIGIDGATGRVTLTDNNFQLDNPIVCRGQSAIPISVWTLITVTQYNTTMNLTDSLTEFRINGILDKSCTGMPYWDTPLEPKTNIYVGIDPLFPDDEMHARLAMWAFWYRPITEEEQTTLANEDPSAVAGPLPLIIFPPPEPGTNMLDYTPLVFTLTPQTSLRGTSTFTLCLRSSVTGAVTPECRSWSSGVAPTGQTFSLINPTSNTGGSINFWWESSFTGTNMPNGKPDSYWLSLFVLPDPMYFARTIPVATLYSNTRTWVTNFGANSNPPTNWEYIPGGAANTGYAYLNMFSQERIDLLDTTELTRIGASPLEAPPAIFNTRSLGFSFSMWLNITGSPSVWSTMSLYKAVMQCTGCETDQVVFKLYTQTNHTMYFTYDTCTVTVPSRTLLQPLQWQHLGISLSSSGMFELFWNGVRHYGPVQCGSALKDYSATNPSWKAARIGVNATGGNMGTDSWWWPLRWEMAQTAFYSRTLVQEEWKLLSISPPSSLATKPLRMMPVTTPPMTLALNGLFTYGMYQPSWFGTAVTVYIGADQAGVFPSNVNAVSEVSGYASLTKLVWTPQSMASASTCIQTAVIKMATSTCTNFEVWLAGDTTHHMTVYRPTFQICLSSIANLEARRGYYIDFTAQSTYAQWVSMPNGAGGLGQLRCNTNDYFPMWVTGSRIVGSYSNPSRTLNGDYGFSIIFNFMQLRRQCSQIMYHNEHFRFRSHCDGNLHVEVYQAGYVDYGYCGATLSTLKTP